MLALAGSLLCATFLPVKFGTPLAVGLLLASIACTITVARMAGAARDERKRVRDADELVTLRRWPEAVTSLKALMDRPMRLDVNRRPALVALAKTLARYGRHDEAIDVADEVLNDSRTDASTRFSVGCGRALLLLQGGRLGDANDAIAGLRREVRQVQHAVTRANRQRDAGEEETVEEDSIDLPAEALLDADDAPSAKPVSPATADLEPAALLFAELYRDVQTNHHDEAIELFETHRDSFRKQLGLRFGDVLAMAALASERLGRTDDARTFWHDATALGEAAELLRRFPELSHVEQLYETTHQPTTGAA